MGIEIVQGDITRERVNAIVNAANVTLLGGGGVDGAIHRAAGSGLLEECRLLGGCKTGQAKLTAGYRLPARWVIHTPGPIWRGGERDEDALLASCYRSCLELAERQGCDSVAFPSISTGVYHFPLGRAAEIALREIAAFQREHSRPSLVRMVCFDAETEAAYLRVWEERRAKIGENDEIKG